MCKIVLYFSVTCRMISSESEKDTKNVSKLATTRELAFNTVDCEMSDGTVKKTTKGIQPFLKRKIRGSEHMITYVAEVWFH